MSYGSLSVDPCFDCPSGLVDGIVAPMAPTPTRTDRIIRTSLVVTAGLILGCQGPKAADYQSITEGMSAAAVESVLGSPSSRLHAPEAVPGHPSAPWTQRWHWGDTLSTSTSSALFPDQPPPQQVGTVWFNAEGQVLRVHAPELIPEPEIDPWAVPPR